MKKTLMVFAILLVLVLGACGGKPTAVPTGTPDVQAGIPNPASKYCEDQGNQVEIRTATDGSQTGYCIFADGTECEEWAYYRGECAPGTPEAPAGMPNPASKYCEDQGNQVEIRTATDGSQTGYCIFADGTECEEWAYYRGECAPGTPKP